MGSKGFSDAVYECCRRVPEGMVTTYGEIARAIGRPGSSRAVGQSLKRNPYAPRVPCHRVVRSDGTIGGYSGSEKVMIMKKVSILESEGILVRKNKIEGFEKRLFRF